MAFTLANCVTLIDDRRRDTGTASVSSTGNGFRAINSSLNIWNQTHEWPWQEEIQNITYNDGADTYALSSDFKSPIDLHALKPAKIKQEFDYVSPNKFDSDRIRARMFTISRKAQGTKIKIKLAGNKVLLNGATSLTGNGTWTASGDASGAATDTNEFFDLTGSVSFDSGGTAPIMTNSTMTAVDLSDFEGRSSLYFNIYMATVSNFTNIVLRFGSSASNYWTTTITTDYKGDSLVAGWNKCKATWASSSGSPNSAAVNYIRAALTFASSGVANDFRLENFFVSEDIPLVLDYYSNNMCIDDGDDTTKRQVFDDSAATTDRFLWTGNLDWVQEAFLNSCMEIVHFLTGEYTDMQVAEKRIIDIVGNLKQKLPSRRRYPELTIVTDLNN